jgi:hypothetical protein
MTVFLVRMARLLLYVALLGGSICALMNGAVFCADKFRGLEDTGAIGNVAVGLVIVTVTLLLDSQARRAELRLEAKQQAVRGFEVVIRDKSAPPGKDRGR